MIVDDSIRARTATFKESNTRNQPCTYIERKLSELKESVRQSFEEQPMYIVEEIVGKSKTKSGEVFFRVKWQGS